MSTNQSDELKDKIIVRHTNGESDTIPVPDGDDQVLKIGRELDNDIVLVDPRASRYHAVLRRAESGSVEIKDLDSANGVLVGVNRIKPNAWQTVSPGQVVQFGETRLFWEKSASSQSTMAMPVQKRTPEPTAVSPKPAPAPQQTSSSPLPWVLGLGGLIALLLIAVIAAIFLFNGDNPASEPEVVEQEVAEATAIPTDEEIVEAEPTTERSSDLGEQSLDSVPTDTPTPEGPQIAIPVLEIETAEVRPIILGALPSTDEALYLVNVRVQNLGNTPFTLSIDDFSLKTSDGEILRDIGGDTSEEGLRRLGAVDRFDDLNLTPGGSVGESLLFELEAKSYDFELVFEPEGTNPVVYGLGTVDAGTELALALGTPVAEDTPVAVAEAETPTPTAEPSPTPTRPAAIPAPNVVPQSALVGTIAYPVFNGNDYDLYYGRADGSSNTFFRPGASQPAFNADGSRIAFHSWSNDSRGLVTTDVTGANGTLVTNFIEDQLPTWSSDGQDIIFLTRRSGNRQSELMRANASTELADGTVLGEGEYPTVASNGQLAFKGWGTTAFGLRVGTEALGDLQSTTNVDEDTAPALSPDGTQVVFMSRRENNWDVYLANVDGSGLQRLTTDEASDGLPTWSPDGDAIAFVSNRGGPWAIWVMTPEGDGKSQLFTMEGSPDGMVGGDSYASRGWAEERISWTAAEVN